MAPPPGHLAAHPLPPGIAGALGLSGYQLLAEVAGVGAGRLGSEAFLLLAPDPEPSAGEPMTHLAYHARRVRDEGIVALYTRIAAQLGYLRLGGYRLVPERHGLRSKIAVVDPASGAIALQIPDRHPGRLLGGALIAPRLIEALRALAPAGPPPDPSDPQLLREALLALALADPELGGAQAAELADRALELLSAQRDLDLQQALSEARRAISA
ncbi:MAG TPA: hypothetical protein VKU89_04985 [Solirubrobacteraceae bacterium]|nr:hypothetical protein [Solirubrobacteraceae bacterium]